jgi:hypothetical protein
MINYYKYESKISERKLSLKDSFKMWAMLRCLGADGDSDYMRVKNKRKPFRY